MTLETARLHAAVLLQEALEINRQLGNRSGIASSLLNLGIFADRRGDYSLAMRLTDEALSMQQTLSDKYMTAMLLTLQAEVACYLLDCGRAFRLCRDGLNHREAIGNLIGIGSCLPVFARIAADFGETERAVSWIAAADAIDQTKAHVTHPTERAELARFASDLREKLGEARYLDAWERGHLLTIEAAAAEASAMECSFS